MGLRRKSMVKSTQVKVPQNVDQTETPHNPAVEGVKRARCISQPTLSDATLNALLNPLSLLPPPAPNDEQATSQKVEEAKQQLGTLENEIISALFPLSGSPESFDSLASRLGMSVKEVREIADNALRGLRGSKGFPSRNSSAWN